MATRTDNNSNLVYDVSTDPHFQAFCTFVKSVLDAGGWTQTSDTGQMNVATATHPAAVANTKAGYLVYAMADSLQATKPVFVRFDFGCSNTVNCPALWITIGTGSNGSGTITGLMFNGGAVTSAQVRGAGATNTTTPVNSYGSADTARVQLLMYQATSMLILSITRTVNSSGVYNSDGVCVSYCNNQGNTGALALTQFLPFPGGGGTPTSENGGSIILSSQANSTINSNTGIGLLNYFNGFALSPPGDIVVVNSGDFAAEAQFTMTVYGASHTFQLGAFAGSCFYIGTGGGGTQTLRSNTRIGIRFD
ncbi:MAG: hypothetical protein ACREPM_21785 [Gemmatimonadaceae bacterium]